MEDAETSDAAFCVHWVEQPVAVTALRQLNYLRLSPAILCWSPSLLANHSFSRLR
jgi:hypothetical protein